MNNITFDTPLRDMLDQRVIEREDGIIVGWYHTEVRYKVYHDVTSGHIMYISSLPEDIPEKLLDIRNGVFLDSFIDEAIHD
jgi:hypothetical protein